MARTLIHAPPAVVFNAVSDFANSPQRISGIKAVEILTPGPVGKGTRFRETRMMFGKQASETMTVADWNPPRSYTLECQSCGCHYRFTVACAPDGASPHTAVEMSFESQPVTFMAKLFSPLGKLMMGACRKAFEKDIADLKRSVEAPSAPGSSAPRAV
jgi:hypothetical protein